LVALGNCKDYGNKLEGYSPGVFFCYHRQLMSYVNARYDKLMSYVNERHDKRMMKSSKGMLSWSKLRY
jgi:hypothetical protein